MADPNTTSQVDQETLEVNEAAHEMASTIIREVEQEIRETEVALPSFD